MLSKTKSRIFPTINRQKILRLHYTLLYYSRYLFTILKNMQNTVIWSAYKYLLCNLKYFYFLSLITWLLIVPSIAESWTFLLLLSQKQVLFWETALWYDNRFFSYELLKFIWTFCSPCNKKKVCSSIKIFFVYWLLWNLWTSFCICPWRER